MQTLAKLMVGLGALAVMATAAAGPASASNLVNNGGFETGDFTGWTFTGDTLDDFVDNGTASNLSPHSGSDFAALGSTGMESTLSQEIATTPGADYHLSFYLVSDGQSAAGGAADQNFEAQFGGQDLILQDYQSTNYQKFILNGVGGSGSDSLLKFTFRDDVGYTGLDDVSVQSGSAPVPEASSFVSFGMLMLAGLAGFAIRFRRKAA